LRQEANLRYGDANVVVFRDIGSGLNFKRSGLYSLLDAIMCGRIQVLMVTYRDRLARLGFEIFEWLCQRSQTKIVVLNSKEADPTERVTEDLLAILTVFSARAHGLRSYKRSLEKEFETGDEKTREDSVRKTKKRQTKRRKKEIQNKEDTEKTEN